MMPRVAGLHRSPPLPESASNISFYLPAATVYSLIYYRGRVRYLVIYSRPNFAVNVGPDRRPLNLNHPAAEINGPYFTVTKITIPQDVELFALRFPTKNLLVN